MDLAEIPRERLALLDKAMLFHGSHDGGSGGPDCKHCARELLFEVVTGEHKDATPPGCTALMAILPRLNDGPWRDDEQRTEVMRPYLRKMLALDPAHDQRRVYALIDHVYRVALPDVCDALKMDKHGSALRDLGPIVDAVSARAAKDALQGFKADAADAAAAYAYAAYAADAAAASAADAAAASAASAYAAADAAAYAYAAAASAAYAYASASAYAYASASAYADAAAYAAAARSERWERNVKRILDIICAA